MPGLVLRRDWLASQVKERPAQLFAEQLNRLAGDAERLDEEAREALVAVVAFLVVQDPEGLPTILERCAMQHDFGSLLRLLRRYPQEPALDDAEKNERLTRRGNEITLGERKSMARHPNRRNFERLFKDPHPHVIRQLLGNPHLTENDVIALCTSRPRRRVTVVTLAHFPDWLVRPRIRMAIIFGPVTPSQIAVPLVALATRPELQEIADSPSLHVVLRATAQQLLERHPPLGPVASFTLQ